MKNYCPRIHHGLTLSQISNSQLSYSACCWMPPVHSSNTVNWHHPHFEQMRLANSNGQLLEKFCRTCMSMETAGQQSQRQGYEIGHGNATFDNSIQYLDINIDYTCNSACISCGPELSTTWRKELGIKNQNVRPKLEAFIATLEHLDLSTVREIRFWGGEPFLTSTWKHVLQWISERYDSSTIKLMFNTNGTVRIDDQSKSLIEKFKFARISFSIDAIGPAFEYIRYPGSWRQVDENLFWWKKNLPHNAMLSLTVVASVMNVLLLDQVLDYCGKNFAQSVYGDPIEIFIHPAFGVTGLENMPLPMVEHFRNLENYKSAWIQKLPTLGTNKNGPAAFVDYIRLVDQRRNLYLYDVLPEVASFFNYGPVKQPDPASIE